VTVAASKTVSEKGTENIEIPQVDPKLKSVVIGPSMVQAKTVISDPLIPVIPSLIKKVILSYIQILTSRSLRMLTI
jgi:hypothetical protein